MAKDIVECVHWDPEVDPAQQETRQKNKWVLLAGGLAVLAVAVGVSLWILLPAREPVPAGELTSETGQAGLPVSQTEPGTPQAQPPGDPATTDDPVLAQGIEYYKTGNYQMAVSSLDLALSNNPESGEAYSYRGLSYFSLGKYQEAITDLTQSLRYLGFRADVITVRGISYYFTARYPECIGDLTRAIEMEPANNNAYTYRAMAYDATNRADLAAADRARIS